MSIRNLDKIFKPRRVAVIGASPTPGKVGYTVLANLVGPECRSVIYPVNPKLEAIQGIRAYPRVSELPETADLAVICTPAETVPDLVDECGSAGIRGVVIISAGFGEAGEPGRALEHTIRGVAAKFDHLRIMGPNCLGFMAPHSCVNASFAGKMPRAGRVAFASQSGALCTSILDWAHHEDVGFSYFVSIGNMLDVDFGDLIDYFSEDGSTDSIILYVESITNARKFMSAARAFAATKPIVAETEEAGERKLIGVGRLVFDPNHETAEYAVLVADPWQGQGLGSKLTDYCLEIAADRGIQRVEAVTDLDNHRMLTTFRQFGFERRDRPQDGVAYLTKRLGGGRK